MKALITGATGFIGSYLCNFLIGKNIQVYGTYHKNVTPIKKVEYIKADLQNTSEISSLINTISPDYIFHLAAQSLVSQSWRNSEETLQVNIFSTLHILDAVKNNTIKTRILIFGSASEYAASEEPITEDKKLQPNSPYAISKIVQDELGYLYNKSYGLHVIRIRPFYIIGQGKKHDALYDFCKGIIAIEKGNIPILPVGNLEVIRDFVDIHDAVKAIWLIATKGLPGEVYNICSGKGISMQTIVNKLLSYSQKKIKIKIDKNKFRPIDEPVKIGDNTKLKNLGWSPEIHIDETLKKTLEYWQNKKAL